MPDAVLHRWNDIPEKQLAPGVRRKFVTADRVTIARFSLSRDAVVPVHSHEHEQVSYVVSGVLRFEVDGKAMTVEAGQALQIPTVAKHGVTAVEDTEVIDVFSPVRQDWLDGTDTYFTR